MKGPGLQVDERSAGIMRKICTRLYLFTIAALWLDVCWRQFILNQPLSEFLDLAVLMTANVLLAIGAVLYYGGVTVPVIRTSAVAALYVVCVTVGTVATIYKYRPVSAREILWKLVLIAAISGLIVVLYIIAAYLSARKAAREIDE